MGDFIKKSFGPPECWCAPGGGAFYPCKKNKLCKETNEKYNKMLHKYLNSKKYKKDEASRKKRNLENAKRRSEHKRRREKKLRAGLAKTKKR